MKCQDCGKDYERDFELIHFNKECSKATECQTCKHKHSLRDKTHECVPYLLQYQKENKRKSKGLKK